MSEEQTLSEILRAVQGSAAATAAEENMHAEVRLSKNGLIISVTKAGKNGGRPVSLESALPWSEVDRSDALDVTVSGAVLTVMAQIKHRTHPLDL